MSYDLHVWCVAEPSIPDAPLASGPSWLLQASCDACLDEDIPPTVIGQLPGIRHLVHLSLEPSDAPKAGVAALWKMARSIAKATRGVIEDPQAEAVELPSGLRRFAAVKRTKDERVSKLELSWWFDHGRTFERATLERLLDLFERDLPEALPRRYGLWEPAQHELAQTGRTHLLDFLVENAGQLIVWKCARPLSYVSSTVTSKRGWVDHFGHEKLRMNRFSIGLDAAALDQPGWQLALERAWRNISAELAPFYGDVRTLHGYVGSGMGSDNQTEQHPIKSVWWNGIPERLGHAVVIGAPYLELWPELATRAQPIGQLALLSTSDWRSTDDVASLVGGVPTRLTPGLRDYPATFPFAHVGTPVAR